MLLKNVHKLDTLSNLSFELILSAALFFDLKKAFFKFHRDTSFFSYYLKISLEGQKFPKGSFVGGYQDCKNYLNV